MISIEDQYDFQVRGYELDGFGHVNNAVYQNYYEEARWQFIKHQGLYEILMSLQLHAVVTRVEIRYLRELRLFDEACVKTQFEIDGEFLIAKQRILLRQKNILVSKAIVENLLVHKEDRFAYSIPSSIKMKIQTESGN